MTQRGGENGRVRERYRGRKRESSLHERTNAEGRKNDKEMERRRNHRIPHFVDVTEHNGNPVAEKAGKGGATRS